VFLVLKGPHRGQPLTPAGLDEVMDGARRRAGLVHATCHELRHTCLTRLREAGMALEAVQAQAGHASIESTRIYLHLADDWLASQYRTAAEAIDAQMLTRPAPPPPPPDPSLVTSSPSTPSTPSSPRTVPVAPVVSAFSPRSTSPGTARPDVPSPEATGAATGRATGGAARSLRVLRGTGRDGIRGGRGGAR
jgi:hypothetical protein